MTCLNDTALPFATTPLLTLLMRCGKMISCRGYVHIETSLHGTDPGTVCTGVLVPSLLQVSLLMHPFDKHSNLSSYSNLTVVSHRTVPNDHAALNSWRIYTPLHSAVSAQPDVSHLPSATHFTGSSNLPLILTCACICTHPWLSTASHFSSSPDKDLVLSPP